MNTEAQNETWAVVLRNGEALRVMVLPDDAQRACGFRYFGFVQGHPHLWRDDGAWRDSGHAHPLDIRHDSVPLLTA